MVSFLMPGIIIIKALGKKKIVIERLACLSKRQTPDHGNARLGPSGSGKEA
jgi:hypothetical protein